MEKLYSLFALIFVTIVIASGAHAGNTATGNKAAGNAVAEKMPGWLEKLRKSERPPIEIEKYLFKSETVYLLSYVCCDQGTRELYNSKGKLICQLPESFAGLDDSKCPGFVQDAKHLGSVFKKP